VSINVDALSSTISTIVAQAVQSALSHNNMPTTLPSGRSTEQDAAAERAVERETSAIATSSAGTESLHPIIENSDPKPKQVFTSLAVSLASRVSAKLKAKIWASEYVDFGSLLFSSPQNEGKYSLSMTPSGCHTIPKSPSSLVLLPNESTIFSSGCLPLIYLSRFTRSGSKMKRHN